jgi:hypothetical protein
MLFDTPLSQWLYLENCGTHVGLAGALIMLQHKIKGGTSNAAQQDHSLEGDLVALHGTTAGYVYLVVSCHLQVPCQVCLASYYINGYAVRTFDRSVATSRQYASNAWNLHVVRWSCPSCRDICNSL